MKKILIPVILGMLSSPVMAQPSLQDFVRELGYTEAFIAEGLPEIAGKKSDLSRAKAIPARKITHEPVFSDLSDPSDLLHPRVFQKGESPQMIPVLLRLQKQNPTSDKITRKLAVTCLRNGQPREALYWYIQTYQRDRSDFESLWNMASIAYRLGEMDQARKYLQEYASLDPKSAWGRMAREFLAGSFSGKTLNDGFKAGFGRTGVTAGESEESKQLKLRLVSEGKSVDSGQHGHGVMVIEGQRTSFRDYMRSSKYKEPPVKAKKATLEGKRVSSQVPAGAKSSLAKAKIVVKPVQAEALVATDATALLVPNITVVPEATAPPLIP